MVDYDHLSAHGSDGSAGSSPRDIFSRNPSPLTSVDSHGFERVLLTASQELLMDMDGAASAPLDVIGSNPPIGDSSSPLVSKDGSSKSSNFAAEIAPIGSNLEATSSILRAAQHFAHHEREELIDQRRKNLELLAFLEAKGHSINDLNSFVSSISKGKSVLVDDNNFKSLSLKFSTPNPMPIPFAPSSPKFPVSDFPPLPVLPNGLAQEPVVTRSSPLSSCPLADPSPTPMDGMVSPATLHKSSTFPDFPPKADLPKVDFTFSGAPRANVPSTSKDAHTPIRSWKNVLQTDSTSKITLNYFPPSIESNLDTVTISPPRDVLLKGSENWSSCIVGKFFSSRLPFKMVEEAANKMWNKHGLLKVFIYGKDGFLFKFSSVAERDNVLALGPWYIFNKALLLKAWHEGVDFNDESSIKLPVWIKLHHIPLSYWTPDGLSYLASAIGRPLHVDALTAKMEPMQFARVCVEIQANATLPDVLNASIWDEVALESKTVTVQVEYQNLPPRCNVCKSFGHSSLKCSKATYKWVPKSSIGNTNTLGDKGNASLATAQALDTNVIVPPCAAHDAPLTVEVASPHPSGFAMDTTNVVAPVINPVPIEKPQSPTALDPTALDPLAHPLIDGLLPSCSNNANGVKVPSNPFTPLADFSDTDFTPPPDPLVSKLKTVDEKDLIDLKAKARGPPVQVQSSKKKPKGGGKKPSS